MTTDRKCICPSCPNREGCSRHELEDLDQVELDEQFDPWDGEPRVSAAWDPRRLLVLGPGLAEPRVGPGRGRR